jgi:hypothetical protein
MQAGLAPRIALALFGACSFASSIEIVLHESGHAMAAVLLGADVARFDVPPYRRSEVAVSYDGGRRSESSLLFSSAGILVAAGVSACVYVVTRARSHFWLPFQCLGPWSLFAEGSYLIGDHGDGRPGDWVGWTRRGFDHRGADCAWSAKEILLASANGEPAGLVATCRRRDWGRSDDGRSPAGIRPRLKRLYDNKGPCT